MNFRASLLDFHDIFRAHIFHDFHVLGAKKNTDEIFEHIFLLSFASFLLAVRAWPTPTNRRLKCQSEQKMQTKKKKKANK